MAILSSASFQIYYVHTRDSTRTHACMHVHMYAYVHVHYHVRQILSYRMTQTRSFQLYSLVSYGYFAYQLILQKSGKMQYLANQSSKI